MDESWTRLLDSDYDAHDLARELSGGFLDFVREESDALDAAVRCKILMALLYLSDEKLQLLRGSIVSLCSACENEGEEWVRIVAAMVMRWLLLKGEKHEGNQGEEDHDDAFIKVVSRLAHNVANADAGRRAIMTTTTTTMNAATPYPSADVLPTHWPFLDSRALPPSFQAESVKQNPHFKARTREQGRAAASAPRSAPASAGTGAATSHATARATSPPPAEVVLPPKLKELLEHAPLLTPENRATIERFCSAPASFPSEVTVPLFEEKRDVALEPGKFQTATIMVKLDPVNNKWTKVTKLGPKRLKTGGAV